MEFLNFQMVLPVALLGRFFFFIMSFCSISFSQNIFIHLVYCVHNSTFLYSAFLQNHFYCLYCVNLVLLEQRNVVSMLVQFYDFDTLTFYSGYIQLINTLNFNF